MLDQADDPRQAQPRGDDLELREISTAARELAERAGKTLLASLEIRDLQVQFKGQDFADPVSAVDKAIEDELRIEIARRFPDHAIVGEERGGAPIDPKGYVWALDPIDGTTNFVRRYPLFASSIGVLLDGVPVTGAVWCSATPLCRPGVYHVRDGRLFHDDEPAEPWNRGSKRPLVGDVGPPRRRVRPYDRRASGSAAVECVMVAAGVLDAARFRKLWVWDVAGGLALVRAANVPIWSQIGRRWQPFTRFEAPQQRRAERVATLADWHRPLLLGPLDAAGF